MNILLKLALLPYSAFLLALSAPADDGWTNLFNGRDLEGWVNVNAAPETWTVRDGLIACTGQPIAALRTVRCYENFELELEWRHLKPGGNAGVFIWASALPAAGQPFLRAIEVQVLDNGYNPPGKNVNYTTHGDVFPIHGASMKPIHQGKGARCFPSEEHSKSSPEWNHYRIVCRDGSLRLSVNGHEVSGGDECQWRKGYIGLESEGSPTEWRNLRIKELPSGGASPDQGAPVEEGWRPLYNGVDGRGWRPDGFGTAWKADDWMVRSAGGPARSEWWTANDFGDLELLVDVRLPAGADPGVAGIALRAKEAPLLSLAGRPGEWTRRKIVVAGSSAKVMDETGQVLGQATLPAAVPPRGPLALVNAGGGEVQFANVQVRER